MCVLLCESSSFHGGLALRYETMLSCVWWATFWGNLLCNRICKKQIPVTHWSWHTRQDAATTQWLNAIIMLYGELFVVCCFLFCFFFLSFFPSFLVGVMRLKRSLMSQETYKFIANHPFILVIHERQTHLTLFIGRYTKPTAVVVHHTELWLCICFEFVSILGWGGSCSQHKCWSL